MAKLSSLYFSNPPWTTHSSHLTPRHHLPWKRLEIKSMHERLFPTLVMDKIVRTGGASLNISSIPDLSFEHLGLIYHRSMVAKDSLANLVVERRAHPVESSKSINHNQKDT